MDPHFQCVVMAQTSKAEKHIVHLSMALVNHTPFLPPHVLSKCLNMICVDKRACSTKLSQKVEGLHEVFVMHREASEEPQPDTEDGEVLVKLGSNNEHKRREALKILFPWIMNNRDSTPPFDLDDLSIPWVVLLGLVRASSLDSGYHQADFMKGAGVIAIHMAASGLSFPPLPLKPEELTTTAG